MNLQPVDINDKAQWYEIRRNELLELLKKTSALEITEKYANELAGIRKKCLENQFEIVLLGEFQGGKSTTFDALCDGRDLSPRGLNGGGIKTSAAILSAQNISNGETQNGMEEWAEITFKSKGEIQKGMFDILGDVLKENQAFLTDIAEKNNEKNEDIQLRMCDADYFASVLDQDNSLHRHAVQCALDTWWQQWQKDHSALDDDQKDLLRIATQQERFYGTPEYLKLTQKNIVGIYDFQDLIKFPTDWEIRWTDGKNATFSFEDAAFVFIAKTLLRIKSQNMEKLGCRITDCPGLFANAYDTTVARRAINSADGIWYLIGGDKQIAYKDLECLELVKSLGLTDKITGSVNLRGKHEQKIKVVLPVTQTLLKEKGYDFPLFPYNARLAFLAAQGGRLQKDMPISPYDRKCMEIDSDNAENFNISEKEMWVDMVSEMGVATGLKTIRNIQEFSSESVSDVQHASMIDDVTSYLNRLIISKKAKTILLDNGSEKAVNALLSYESILKTSEDAAQMDEQEWQKKVEETKNKLKDFIAESTKIIEVSGLISEKKLFSEKLALDLVKATINDDFILDVAVLIVESVNKYKDQFFWNKEAFSKKVQEKVAEKFLPLFVNSISRTLNQWIRASSDSCETWEVYKKKVQSVCQEIRDLWRTKIDGDEWLSGLDFNLPEEDALTQKLESLNEFMFSNEEVGKYLENLRTGIGSTLFIALAAIPTLIFLVLVSLIKQVIKKREFSEEEQNKKREEDKRKRDAAVQNEAKEKIVPQIEDKLRDSNMQTKLSEPFVKTFEEIQDGMIFTIQHTVTGLLDTYEKDHIEPAKRNQTKSESKRKEIAEHNHKIRTEQIEPLRKEIQDFEATVSAEWDRINEVY